MNFEKAFKELMNGKKIRRKEWESLMHMRIIKNVVKTFKGEYTNFFSSSEILTSDGWLVVDGDSAEFTFIEALEHLKNKKSITHKDWLEKQSDKFIFVDKDQMACCRSVEYSFMPTYQCFCATDWEIMK